MLGIDLYARYNLVTDWHAVYASGVREVFVKLSDGAGPAAVRGDGYVAAARAVGMKVGGYHYMQPSPSPEAQADVFVAELRRLKALDIAPALDLEAAAIPTGVRVAWAQRFLKRVQADLNVVRVMLYSPRSWLDTLRPDTWGMTGLVTWDAEYGPNDGREHPGAYTGHVTVHQYTSSGHLPGISGLVDLDDVLGDITATSAPAPATPVTREGDDMAVVTGEWPAGQGQRHGLICPVGTVSQLTAQAWVSLAVDQTATSGHLWFTGGGRTLHDAAFTLPPRDRQWWAWPDGADYVTVHYDSTDPVTWGLESKPK